MQQTESENEFKKTHPVATNVYRNNPVHFVDPKLYDSKFSRHLHRQGIEPFAS